MFPLSLSFITRPKDVVPYLSISSTSRVLNLRCDCPKLVVDVVNDRHLDPFDKLGRFGVDLLPGLFLSIEDPTTLPIYSMYWILRLMYFN